MKKHQQLGMNAGTASHRLVKDLLFRFVQASGEKCFRCGGELTRQTFSIEHKVPWLDSDDPVGKYFDLENIAFSHRVCNGAAARKPNKRFSSDIERVRARWAREYGDPVKYQNHLARKRKLYARRRVVNQAAKIPAF